MTGASASKRRRMMQSMVSRLQPPPATPPAVPPFVKCQGTTRRDPRASVLTGCRETLAEIRVDAASIAFVVLAPIHDEGGVWVLERTAQPGHPEQIVHDAGRRVAFRCARCAKVTLVDMVKLRRLARAQA